MNTTSRTAGRSSLLRWLVPVVIVVIAVVLIAIVVIQAGRDNDAPPSSAPSAQVTATPPAAEETTEPSASEQTEEPERPDATMFERRVEGDPHTLGPVDAPVGLVVYSDYQCGFCASWNADTLPELARYAEDGKLRIEWRDANVFGDASVRASTAAYAAGLQGAFWEYHDALFPDGAKRSADQLSEDALAETARDLGLDVEQFRADFASEDAAMVIQNDMAESRGIGVTSTPSFLLGGQPIVGAQPTQVFVDALEQALAAAGE
ncbi:DsbA family protein [Microbacterium amylolyticum]|uniref:Protein-disulfide isomerase n=1 Tax=Microbacterium amylolyticum TaxID=936337 RepID=A0ABS4ZJY4_9MICO|nr:thioredoxin domain-containing protein [Microbacterium amylolyticum]MBP2437343.1 protein-disulfide isomerase [Microbacterium amylolyticum]